MTDRGVSYVVNDNGEPMWCIIVKTVDYFAIHL